MMLAHQHRIKAGKRIDEVKDKGRLFQSDNFGVSILGRDGPEPPQFAFVISTKISNFAVHRNRIQRSLNEGVRRNLGNIPKGYDFVFLAKKSLSTKTTEEIIREVEKFFSQLRL